MLVITPYGLRFLIGVPSLGQTCFSRFYSRFRAEEYVYILLSPSCRSSIKNWYPPNGSPRSSGSFDRREISCQDASDRLLALLQLPKCENLTDEEYQQDRLGIARIIVQENLGSESLKDAARALLRTPTPMPGPTPGTGIMDWLKRNWVPVAIGAAILLLLARRR
jgi:hypothetical protein